MYRFAALVVLALSAHAAEPKWIKARLGSFEAISDSGRKSATEALGQFEQLRFAIGAAMGQPDLRLDPPLRIIVFKNQTELQRGCFNGLRMGRDRIMACATAETQLSPEVAATDEDASRRQSFRNACTARNRVYIVFQHL